MHPSEHDSQSITPAQVEQLYALACEMFPNNAGRFQQLMDDLDTDKATPKEQFQSLLSSIYDWFHYGN